MIIHALAAAATPLLTPVLTGLWPAWWRRMGQTALTWAIIGLPLGTWAQVSGYAQLDRRVTQLEERTADLEKLMIRHDEFHQRVTRLLENHQADLSGINARVTMNREAVLRNESRDEFIWLGVAGVIGTIQLLALLYQVGFFKRNGKANGSKAA